MDISANITSNVENNVYHFIRTIHKYYSLQCITYAKWKSILTCVYSLPQNKTPLCGANIYNAKHGKYTLPAAEPKSIADKKSYINSYGREFIR